MANKKLILENTNVVVDLTTGEALTKTTSTVVRLPSEPAYVKMYIDDVCSLVGITAADQTVLRHLLLRLDYEGYVLLSTRIRTTICKHLNITTKTLSNRISSLVKSNMLISVSRNEYMVNPNYFARGEWKRICELRKNFSLKLSYKATGERQISFSTNEKD